MPYGSPSSGLYLRVCICTPSEGRGARSTPDPKEGVRGAPVSTEKGGPSTHFDGEVSAGEKVRSTRSEGTRSEEERRGKGAEQPFRRKGCEEGRRGTGDEQTFRRRTFRRGTRRRVCRADLRKKGCEEGMRAPFSTRRGAEGQARCKASPAPSGWPSALNPSWKATVPCGVCPSKDRAKKTSCGTPSCTSPGMFLNPNFL